MASGHISVEITHVNPEGGKLKSNKGINLPDSKLQMLALMGKDTEDLMFVAADADAVCSSFVGSAKDVRELQSRLKERGGEHLGIVLKIETLEAFEHLP